MGRYIGLYSVGRIYRYFSLCRTTEKENSVLGREQNSTSWKKTDII